MRLDAESGETRRLDQANALNLAPLGWANSRVLFTIARSTDTAIYAWAGGRSTLLGILMPQVLMSALLSPDRRFVAFGTPTGCTGCTLDVYDIAQQKVLSGPTGVPNELDFAWTANSKQVVTMLRNQVAVLELGSATPRLYPRPSTLSLVWSHPMSVQVSASTVKLTDTVTHKVYISRR